MDSKIFVNSSIVTKSWLTFTGKILLFLVIMPYLFLVFPAALVWFVSLGHINLVGLWSRYSEVLTTKVFGEE